MESQQPCQIGRLIDVQSNAGELKHVHWLAGSLRSCQVGEEAVIAEAQRKQICGPAENRIGPTTAGRRYKHRTLLWCGSKDLLDLCGSDQREITGHDQRELRTARNACACGRFNCAGFAGVDWIVNDREGVPLRHALCVWIARYERDEIAVQARREGQQARLRA